MILIVGQAPSASSDPSEPLSGRSGRRLASLCGMTLEEFLRAFDRVNLLPEFPGKASKGDRFPMAAGRSAAKAILAASQPRRCVLLGTGVWKSFGLPPSPAPFLWLPAGPRLFSLCPHPSGVNRWWNDPLNEGQARSFWLRLHRSATALRDGMTISVDGGLSDSEFGTDSSERSTVFP
jgi:uracil-DNA glycosylase